MTLETGLDADWQRRLANVRAAVGRIWASPLHRHYTNHGLDHSQRVIALLDGLTSGVQATDSRLSPDEVFVLLAGAYLHDVGMQDERFASGDLEAIRARHHERSAEWIRGAGEAPAIDLGLPGEPGLVEAVALVALGHRQVDLSAECYAPLIHASGEIRVRLLAALLRLADALDLDHRRVNLDLLKLTNLPLESCLHWYLCYYVSGVMIKDEYVRIAYQLPETRSDYADLIVPLVERDVRAELDRLEKILRAHRVKPAIGSSQVRSMRTVDALPPELEDYARGRGVDAVQVPVEPAPPAWNLAAIREFLLAALDDGELSSLCFDYFRPVYERFTAGLDRGRKVHMLVEHCDRQGEMDKLVERVRERNPYQYGRFAARLKG
jgi:hypothetical protein